MSSSSSTIIPRNVHFLALVHGMWGTPEHLARVEETIKEKYADVEGDTEFVSLRIRTNAESHTYDGLDWGAERAVKEIYQTVEEIESDGHKKVAKFSIFGYSLGGLISRYTIGSTVFSINGVSSAISNPSILPPLPHPIWAYRGYEVLSAQ
ncbi:DUF676 domain-containing protein [Rhizoctonia solani AG-1 IA]|uniref:DUF676 domain-containing protein n=1 Tax=Thanatephorus cucumeris (strain AG1-IA) TaxID=983506 RepID=L8WHS2_THACA|nr:DUF676 domain-containing protein [Rhizoctonia solani AG-1 IA]